MTIKDLAAKTGYAVGTVSRALNGHPNVSAKASRAILQAAQECGFELNLNAKQLKQAHSNTILVVVKGTSNELFGSMVETIQSLVAKTRYHLSVDYLDEDHNEVIRAVQLCREKKPVGLLFLGGNTRNFQKDFEKIDVPSVVITHNASALAFPNLSSVSTDDTAAARCAIDTLIGLGHRQIAVIGGDRERSDTSRLRYEGCEQSFREHGIGFDPKRDYQTVRYSCQEGYRAAKALLEAGSQFTAIFATADVLAIGAVRALWEAGKRVPQDVSVLGFDGLPLGTYLIPQLATVSQSTQTMALRSVALLLDMVEEGKPAAHETVPFQLLARESIRPLL